MTERMGNGFRFLDDDETEEAREEEREEEEATEEEETEEEEGTEENVSCVGSCEVHVVVGRRGLVCIARCFGIVVVMTGAGTVDPDCIRELFLVDANDDDDDGCLGVESRVVEAPFLSRSLLFEP